MCRLKSSRAVQKQKAVNCNEFNKQLASMKNLRDMAPEMCLHMEECASCREAYVKTELLLAFIDEEKSIRAPAFITTRIMAQTEQSAAKPRLLRPVFVTAMSVIFLIVGFLSAGIFQSMVKSNTDTVQVIASDYYFADNPASKIEEIWINIYQYE
jgi:hypothetical protein